MSEKTLKRAIGALALLAAVYVVVLLTRGGSARLAPGEALAALEGLEASSMSGAVITGPESTIELTRSGDGWQVNGYVADSASVARFWEAVEELDVRDLVASNPSNHGRLGVSEDSTWTLSLRPTEGDPVDVLLGKSGPSFSSAYARVPGADEVYLLEGGVRAAATRRVDDWRDRTIARVDTAAVWSVSLVRDGTLAAVARSDEGWTFGDAPADSAAVTGLLGELSRLEATGFAADTVIFEGDDRREIVAAGVTGDTLAVIEIVDADGTLLARSASSPTIFTVPSWRVDRLVPDAAALTAAPEPGDGGS